ncbi:sigma-54 dependent transcriptional regulator [bacterium]|nr:sigma-54 dependent transcriptional regulator [bacterium]
MSFSANILIIDDDESIRIGCLQTLTEEGYRVQAVDNGYKGLELTRKESFDVILLDLKMPGISGIDVLKKLREDDPNSIVIMITGYAKIDSAVQTIKLGAYDYLPKPFTAENLISAVKKAVSYRQQILEEACMLLSKAEESTSDSIIGRSNEIKKVVMLINKVASTDSTVLVTGETGVGKELVARTIHRLSKRREKPFVVVDCGVLVESLFESELFGHTRGSFTGATETTQGKFELANGGTIFLDEIANISINMQSRLLRVIQEQEISKIGSMEKLKVDVRIISATNKNLQNAIRNGTFREDLFYRFNVFPIHVPPLRQRRDDILPLAHYFLKGFNTRKKKAVTKFSGDAMQFFENYDWPGNVRELKNAVECAMVNCEGNMIGLNDLSFNDEAIRQHTGIREDGSLAELEKNEITKTLRQFDGHKSKAADYLGINRKTLREKIRKYGLDL